MSCLTNDNLFGRKLNELSSSTLQKRKFMYLEGLIRFLELYAQNEIGNVELDIEKISLYINSPMFENIDLTKITSIEDVYQSLTNDLEHNIPLFRFFKLSKYQQSYLEKDHYDNLLAEYKIDSEVYPCLKCVWYRNDVSDLGVSSICNYPNYHKFTPYRRSYLDITKQIFCKNVTTLDAAKTFISDHPDIPRFRLNDVQSVLNSGVKFLTNKIKTLDNCSIPPYIPKEEHISLKDKIDPIQDLGRAFRNQLTASEIQENHLKSIFLEGMIKFIELYAQNEVGSDFVADIAKIAEYVEYNKLKFNSVEEVYEYLENQIYDGIDMTKFCKRCSV